MIDFLLPMGIKGCLLVSLEDFETNFSLDNQYINLGVTVLSYFLSMWVFQAIAYSFYGLIGGEIFGPKKYRTVFGRHTMDTASMLIMSYMGYESLNNFGGFSSFRVWLCPMALSLPLARRGPTHFPLLHRDYAPFRWPMKPRISAIVLFTMMESSFLPITQ